MNCSPFELKDYFFDELHANERKSVEQHLAACEACRAELHALDVTRATLMSVPEQEPPRRIAFVSDKVFEPNWWQSLWQSAPKLGFASAALLAGAITFHGTRSQPVVTQAPVAQVAVPQAKSEAEVEKRIQLAVSKAVSESEERLLQTVSARLKSTERQNRESLLVVRDYLERAHKQNALVFKRAGFYQQ